MSTHPDGEAQKRVYEQLAAIHLSVAESTDPEEGALEELAELARTLAKGGPYASTVERWARDHGYGQKDPDPGEWDPTGLLRSRDRRRDPDAGPRY